MHARRVQGHAPPGNVETINWLQMVGFGAFWGKQSPYEIALR